jgi:hypothetical protein
MPSLLQISGLLLGKDDLNDQEVKDFADKITSYCERDDKKAQRLDRLFAYLWDEVLPRKNELGEQGFKKVIETSRAKIAEIGGVTGFLPGIEGNKNIKKI